jgi:hypothetical protein
MPQHMRNVPALPLVAMRGSRDVEARRAASVRGAPSQLLAPLQRVERNDGIHKHFDDLSQAARALLLRNWREGDVGDKHYAYSVPSSTAYPWQWYWDSCFHAITWRRFDVSRSRAELESLLAAGDAGFIGHTICWDRPLTIDRAFRYNVRRRTDFMTSTIQPPVLAWAWKIAVSTELPTGILDHHAWLERNRDLEGDGLLWIVQPDESGLDALPKFDHVWGSLAHALPLWPYLVARNRRLNFDARRIRARGHPVVCEVLTNVLWSLSRQAAGQSSVTPQIIDRMWHEESGRFHDVVVNPTRALEPAARPYTWDTLAPLALPDLPVQIGKHLVEDVLLKPRFWDGVPLPSVALDDPVYSSRERFWGPYRHWRGPSWVNSAWLVSLGLRRLGYADHADEMAANLARVVAREGFREYYDSRTGRGMAARGFGWSTLVLDLIDPVPSSATSFLE